MDPLSLETNVRGSLKKFFVDVFGDMVTFDTSLAIPDLRSQGPSAIKHWYNVDFGTFGRQVLSEYMFNIFCLSRQDAEGVELVKACDTLSDLLLDSEMTDGMKRIPLYNVSVIPWVLLTNMVVQDVWDAPITETVEDETKLRILSVRLRWGAKI